MGMGLGMEGASKVRTCPRHYGVCISQSLDYRHVHQQGVRDEFHGGLMVRDVAVFLIRQGDIILKDKPLTAETTINFRLTSRDRDELEKVQAVFVATDIPQPSSNFRDIAESES